MERRTDYTLDELRQLAKDSQPGLCQGGRALYGCAMSGGLPKGFVLNEIGATFCLGDKAAEKDLLDMLQQSDEETQAIAYFYLSYGKNNLSPEGLKVVAAYEAEEINQEIIAHVSGKLAEFIAEEGLYAN